MTRPGPLGIIAEVTHRCPLHCPYCSNPVDLVAAGEEMTLLEWLDILVQARDLGVAQLHLTGGEPLARSDLVGVVRAAHDLGLYTNLITSGISLTPNRARTLKDAGLDHVQISIQAADAVLSDRLARTPAYARKLAAAAIVKALDLPLTLNIVIHRQNIHQIDEMITLARDVGADRLELANVQYYGWALLNQAWLLPTKAQVQRAERSVRSAAARWGRELDIVYVPSDYHEGYPKPCMGGWGARQALVTPNGDVLPCAGAARLPGLPLENIRRAPLAWIWRDSPLFNRFRGFDWMQEPCRSCDRRTIDFGGCRCQAFMLTRDAAATDPVCRHSPSHTVVTECCAAAENAASAMHHPRQTTATPPTVTGRSRSPSP